MKSFVISLLLAITGTVGIAQDNTSNQLFSITISMVDTTIKAGSPVRIKIELTNTSYSDLDASGSFNDMTGQDSNFHVLLRDEKGNKGLKNIYNHPELATGHPIMGRTVKSGATLTEEQDVSRQYDMTHPGKYSIQVTRPISTDLKDGMVKSNIITVTVVAQDVSPAAQ
jgi:hypothetical protein